MKSGSDGRSSNLYLIRSYDHDQHDSPVQSYRPTPRTTIGSGRTNTDITIDSNAAQRRRERKNTMLEINHEKAQQLEVWQVARAATAAKFYFEPLTIPNARASGSIEFTDGGFGQANNPTRTGKQEIEDLYGHTSVGIVVSVGTARKLKSQAKKATFFSTIPDSAREFADTATDPEETHKQVQRDQDRYNKYPYYRLNDPGGLQTELDEWMPKSTWYHKANGGARTITEIEVAFARWLAKIENVQQLKKCAKKLVECRISRMNTSRWERFATGSHYRCRVRACNSADFFDRRQFEKHLAEKHFFEGDPLKNDLVRCRTYWRYQPAPEIKLSS